MISICIPIYNFPVYNLVKQLHQQALMLKINYEILCIDDGSKEHYLIANKNISSLDNVNYQILKTNIGRSKIRNYLAEKAKFNNLLFIDCDSDIISDNYLNDFVQNICENGIVYGGRSHSEKYPKDKKLYLRWLYGKKREDISTNTRKTNPYLFFKTNNFLINKQTLLSVKFNETIKGYGHEDTLFAHQLKKSKIPIIHINNPIVHAGLESAEEFLNKTKEATKNLSLLIEKYSFIIPELKILRAYKKMKRLRLTPIIKFLHPMLIYLLNKNLLSSNPKLFFLDIYKLSYLFYYSK